MYNIIAVILGIIIFSLAGDIFSWDAILISVSIIVSAFIISLTIEEQISRFSSIIKEYLEKPNNDNNKRK